MEENQSLLDLEVDEQASENLIEVSRWSKFLGIVVLVAIGMFLLLFVFLWNSIDSLLNVSGDIPEGSLGFAKGFMLFIFLIIGAVVAILVNFLIKGANRIRYGITNKDQVMFNSGLANLKNYFLMSGILGIIGLFFNLIGLLVR